MQRQSPVQITQRFRHCVRQNYLGASVLKTGITDKDGTVKAIKRPYEAERDRLAKLDLSDDDEQWFADECKRAGVKSMITCIYSLLDATFCCCRF
ncbi:hypothetical protein EMGBS4_06430 [Acidimicrobiaceae bacterium]|nr:hypothetical protein EMGBS4_06430 [Acidimicrobiaceae bacterium]